MKSNSNAFSRWIMVSLAMAIIAFLSGGAWFYHEQQQTIRKKVEEELSAIARLKADQIATWRKDQLADAAAMQEHPFLIQSVARFIVNPSEANARDLRVRFRSLADQHGYADILLVNTNGEVLMSLAESVDRHRGYMSFLADALSGREPVFTGMHTEMQSTPPHISVVVPLFEQTVQSQTPLAALILVIDASQFLYPLVQFWPIPSKTAETLLVQKDGDDALFLNELRHQPGTALKLRIPLRQTDVPAVMAVRGKVGFVSGKDYRGVDVASVILPVPTSPWYMIAKVDAAEAFAEWRFRSVLILALLLGLTAGMGAAGLVLRQRDRQAHYRALYLSEAALRANIERHSVTLKAIGDAVIATDARGLVELLNSAAEGLTGWKQDEARGKPLEEVFRIINEEAREEVESPVTKVLREGIVVGLANHTILIARDGSERPIADSGAPIRDEEGKIIGVVLVFRDQTAERAAQEALRESEARYRALFQASADGILIADIETKRLKYANPAMCRFLGYSEEELVTMSVTDLHPKNDLPRILADFEAQIRGEKTPAEDIPCLNKDGTVVYADVNAVVINVDGRASKAGFFRDITRRKREEADRKKLQAQFIQAQKMESVGRLAGGVAHDYNNILSVIIGYSELALQKVKPEDPLHDDLKEIYAAAGRSRDITRQLLSFARKATIAPVVLDLNASVKNMLKIVRRLIGKDIDLAWHPRKGLWPVLMDPSQLDQILANLCVNARDAIANVGKITIETGTVTFDEAYCSVHAAFTPGDFVLLSVSDNGCGMDRETLDKIFEPFFTTKGIGRGTGLGLATVYGIVKQNNGFINVYSEPNEGTTFRIYLPKHVGDVTEDDRQAVEEAPKGMGETLLVVEDEISILKLTERILTNQNYTVLTARNPSEALKSAESHPGEIALLITDVVMPGMNGRELAEKLKNLFPKIKCLYMSGYTANVIAHRGVLDKGFQFIQKPFSTKDLAAKVRAALEQE